MRILILAVEQYCRWSDLALLVIFKTGYIAVNQVYFWEFNSKVFVLKNHKNLKN